MPQIWMTYPEIADLVGCTPEDARMQVATRALDRRRSHDGQTRVKLDMPWTALFVARIRGSDADLDRAIAELRQLHLEMARHQSAAQSA
jgi:predicted transcriptional regulator